MSEKNQFTEVDLSLIRKKGISIEVIEEQIERFRKGFGHVSLADIATIGNGILKLSEEEEADFEQRFNTYDGVIVKFVPASGAASRMFKHLFEILKKLENQDPLLSIQSDKLTFQFFKELDSFAFFSDLKMVFEKNNGYSLEEAQLKQEYKKILECLLLEEGLNYGNLPKGLLAFHSYGSQSRTPSQEQVFEGLAHLGSNQELHLHLTVSEEHRSLFKEHLQPFDNQITFSVQSEKTDTIAVDEENDPFRDGEGNLLFRPAGHGALLENLNALKEEIIFIKNIDNVVPDSLKEETIRYKKILAGVLIMYQRQIFDLLKRNDDGQNIQSEAVSLLEQLGVKGDFNYEEILELLNRPLRVCGMVKNEGEPGGGPFWVKENDKYSSLQIVEKAQVDLNREDQKSVFDKSTHFNPVDLVCGVFDYKGQKFDLLDYRDEELGFISDKSFEGRTLKAMELPGLWNGSMAKWNTIFVEVPLITFNPVKSVNDLLKAGHQSQ